MIFAKPMWLIGAGMSLDSMRRGFIGGTALALFIDLSGMGQESCSRDLTTLGIYLDLEAKIIELIPWFLEFITRPFEDYHLAAVCFYETAQELCQQKGELQCQGIWETNEELAGKLD
ncbi:hypothetical protein ES703_12971 [subsurface metagenome]